MTFVFTNPRLKGLCDFKIFTNPGIYAGVESVNHKCEKVGLKSVNVVCSISGINAGVSHAKGFFHTIS